MRTRRVRGHVWADAAIVFSNTSELERTNALASDFSRTTKSKMVKNVGCEIRIGEKTFCHLATVARVWNLRPYISIGQFAPIKTQKCYWRLQVHRERNAEFLIFGSHLLVLNARTFRSPSSNGSDLLPSGV